MDRKHVWLSKLLCAAALFLLLTACDGGKPAETMPPCIHEELTDAAMAPGCLTTGLTEGTHCSLCGTVLTAQQVLPATGHAEQLDAAIAPTCTAAGLTAGVHCTVCSGILIVQEEVPVTGHTEAALQAVAPTCTAAGLTAGKCCSVCGLVLTAQEEVPATGHKPVTDAAIPATCTSAGLTAGSHCSVCQVILSARKNIPEKGHSMVNDAAVAATLSTSGLTAGSHCSVCGAVLTAQKPVPALTAAYTAIPCRAIGSYQNVKFSFRDSTTVLQLSLPGDWTLKETGNGFDIYCNLELIGTISATAPRVITGDVPCLLTETGEINDITLRYGLYCQTVNGKAVYTRLLSMTYQNINAAYTVYISVGYAELTDAAMNRILYGVNRADDKKNTIERLTLRKAASPKKILVIGNSFVNSSQIGAILTSMLDVAGKTNAYRVDAVSTGYASVTSYVKSGTYVDKMRSGEYVAVFMCGFYEREDVNHLKTVKAACEASATALVIFPAHNENASVISAAHSAYPELPILNWRQEICQLIETGISEQYFCMNDEPRHSTALGGYVGAYLIYQAIFGTVPQPLLGSGQPIAQATVDARLGHYRMTGAIISQDRSGVKYLG